MENKLLSKKEVTTYLDVSLGMVDKLMKEDLPYIILGKSVRFKMTDIENYLNSNTVKKYVKHLKWKLCHLQFQ